MATDDELEIKRQALEEMALALGPKTTTSVKPPVSGGDTDLEIHRGVNPVPKVDVKLLFGKEPRADLTPRQLSVNHLAQQIMNDIEGEECRRSHRQGHENTEGQGRQMPRGSGYER